MSPLGYFWGMLEVYLLKMRNTKPLGSVSDPYADTDENASTLDIHGNFAEGSKVLLMSGNTLNIPCIVLSRNVNKPFNIDLHLCFHSL